MTDTQPRWTLERDADPDDAQLPHRTISPTGEEHWWSPDELPDVERALPVLNGIEPPRRFTAKAAGNKRWARLVEGIDSIFVAGPFASGEQRDAFVAEFMAPRYPSPPAEDLPPGVVRYDADTLIARGDVVRTLPDGEWERRWVDGDLWATFVNDHAVDSLWYEVRRIQTPDVVQVPWWEALGRRSAHNGKVIATAEHDGHAVVLRCATTDPAWYPDDDGNVAVLAENGPQQ